MDLDQLKQILELVREHELSEFEIEHDGLRLKDPQGRARPGGSGLPAPARRPRQLGSDPAAAAGAAAAGHRHFGPPRAAARGRQRPTMKSSWPS